MIQSCLSSPRGMYVVFLMLWLIDVYTFARGGQAVGIIVHTYINIGMHPVEESVKNMTKYET